MTAKALSAGLGYVPDKHHMLSPHFSHHLRFQTRKLSHMPSGDLHGDPSDILLSGKLESQVDEP